MHHPAYPAPLPPPSTQVEGLRAELAAARQRCAQLEADFLGLDVRACSDVGGKAMEGEMRQAWQAAASFKKR